MFQKLAGPKISRYVQTGANLFGVLFALAWIGFVAFLFVQGAVEFGTLFLILTLLILGLAYVNERPE